MNGTLEPAASPVQPWDEPSARWGHRPMPDDGQMDITPMIDITFLLLIFFLVATRMDTQAQIELPKARNGTAVSAENSVVFTVARGSADRARVYKGDGIIDRNLLPTTDLAEQEKQIVAFVNAGLNAAIPKRNVLIKAEPEVKHREVARVAEAAAQVPDVRLYVAVYEVQ